MDGKKLLRQESFIKHCQKLVTLTAIFCTDILKWNGKYIYFISKIIFYSQIGQNDVDWRISWVLYQTLQRVWTYVCIILKPMTGKNSDNQMEFTSNEFFSSLNYLNFSLFSKVIGNFPKVILFHKRYFNLIFE